MGTWAWVNVATAPGCNDVFAIGTATYDSLDAALAARACDGACLYRVKLAALFVYCGVKGEILELEPNASGQSPPLNETCGPLRFVLWRGSGAFYASQDDFERAHPCP